MSDASLDAAQLRRRMEVRGSPTTVADVIFAAATHTSEHVGQIIYIAKQRLGPAFGTLSIPRERTASDP